MLWATLHEVEVVVHVEKGNAESNARDDDTIDLTDSPRVRDNHTEEDELNECEFWE